jgi:hypothetical protein
MLDYERPRVPRHVGIPGNEKGDQAAKEALDEDISTTERYPPDDLKKWLTEEDFKKRGQRWKNGNNKMKERKPDVDRKEGTKGMQRKEQVAISSLRTGPPTAPRWKDSAIHYAPTATPIYPSILILWVCKKTEDHRINMDMRKE